MPPGRKKKEVPPPVTEVSTPIQRSAPPRFYMQRLPDGSERAVRFRSKADGWRDQTLADFFGTAPEADVCDNMRTMDSLLAEVVKSLGTEESLAPEILAETWQKAAGNALATLSELVSVAEGTACIRVGHPAVRYELTRMKPRIISVLNEQLGSGSVRFVRFLSR